jgi:MGT family glycosyltransferase
LCLEAFAGTDWRVLLSVGERVDAALLNAPNVEVRSWVAQREVLRHASVFVSHAGMNSLMDALAERVPVVALPLTAEQALNAERLTEVGAGRMGDLGSLTATGLRDLVERTVTDIGVTNVLSRDFGARTSTGGARRAADVVEAHGLSGG